MIHKIEMEDGNILKYDVNSGMLYCGNDKKFSNTLAKLQTEKTTVDLLCQPRQSWHFSPGIKCNLNCQHCNATPAKKANLPDLTTDLIDEAFKICPPKKSVVTVCGSGEPLVYPNILSYIHEQLIKIQGPWNYNKEYAWLGITTNGSLLTKDFIESGIVKYYCISIDGTPEIHNTRRTNITQHIENILQYMREYREKYLNDIKKDIYKTNRNAHIKYIDYSVSCTLDNNSGEDFGAIFRYLRSLQPQKIAIGLGSFEKNNPNLPSVKMLKGFSTLIDEYFNLIMHEENYFYNNIVDINCRDYYCRLVHVRFKTHRCPFVYEDYVLDSAGNLHFCHKFIHTPEASYGKLGTPIPRDFIEHHLKRAYVDNIPECKECWIKWMCGGQCYTESYIENNYNMLNLYKPSLRKCELKRGIVELWIRKMYNLLKKDINIWRKLNWKCIDESIIQTLS